MGKEEQRMNVRIVEMFQMIEEIKEIVVEIVD